MNIGIIGTSYKETAITEREKLYVKADQYAAIQRDLIERCELEELVIISTCNRVELYYLYENESPVAEEIKRNFLESVGYQSTNKIQFIHHDGLAAVRHLFQVIAGLESIALGEPQIFGQIKDAFHLATKDHKQNKVLSFVFQHAYVVAKRVRHETQITKIAISISYIATQLAKQIFGDLRDKTILVIGAGNMAELVLLHMAQENNNKVIIANRTISNAVELAEKYHGSAIRIDHLDAHLHKADIIISSTATNGYILNKADIEKTILQRKYQPLFIIDIALPRDIDPKVNNLSSVYLYNIDDLQTVSDDNLKERQNAALEAEKIIEEELVKLNEKNIIDHHSQLIKNFRAHFQSQCEREFIDLVEQSDDFDFEQKQKLAKLARQFIKRLLHSPTLNLKEKIINDDQLFIETMATLFIDYTKTERNNVIMLNQKRTHTS